jgi:hypothetical protein
MSVHFFFNYREHLVKQLKEHYAPVVQMKQEDQTLQLQLEEAESIIRDYFDVVAEGLQEVLDAASSEVMLEYDTEDFIIKFTVVENYVRFIRRQTAIEVEIGRYVPDLNIVENYILAYIVPGEKKCHTRKVGMVHESGNFDENTLNYFLREAFGDIVKMEEKE